MNVHHWISEMALPKATTVADQKSKYLALGNSENQNPFLSEPKWNPKGNSPSIIYKFPKPKVWGTVPASDCIISIKQDNFFLALLAFQASDCPRQFFIVEKLREYFFISGTPLLLSIYTVKVNDQVSMSTLIALPLGQLDQFLELFL